MTNGGNVIKSKCRDDDHRYEIVDVLTVVGWDEDDVAIPCRLESWQCVECGDEKESVEEYDKELDSLDPYDMMTE